MHLPLVVDCPTLKCNIIAFLSLYHNEIRKTWELPTKYFSKPVPKSPKNLENYLLFTFLGNFFKT